MEKIKKIILKDGSCYNELIYFKRYTSWNEIYDTMVIVKNSIPYYTDIDILKILDEKIGIKKTESLDTIQRIDL